MCTIGVTLVFKTFCNWSDQYIWENVEEKNFVAGFLLLIYRMYSGLSGFLEPDPVRIRGSPDCPNIPIYEVYQFTWETGSGIFLLRNQRINVDLISVTFSFKTTENIDIREIIIYTL